jgi:hypothetical protein
MIILTEEKLDLKFEKAQIVEEQLVIKWKCSW